MATTCRVTMATNRIFFSRGLALLLGVALPLATISAASHAQSATGGLPSLAGSMGTKSGAASSAQGPSIVPKDLAALRIEPGDLLSINVYEAPEFTSSYRVDQEGNLTIPLCGKVNVRGLSMSEAAARLEAAFKDGQVLMQPQVNVDVQQYAGQYVTVIGEVGSPGRINLIVPVKLSEILAEAGGVTAMAGARIKIRHGSDVAASEEEISYSRSQFNREVDAIMVRPGDSVTVPRTGIVYVLGAVNRPGGYLMQEDGKLNVAQALALSGGTVMQANTGGLRVIRRNADGTVLDFPLSYDGIAKGSQTPLALQAQDIVYVPMSKLKSVFSTSEGLIGQAATAVIYSTR